MQRRQLVGWVPWSGAGRETDRQTDKTTLDSYTDYIELTDLHDRYSDHFDYTSCSRHQTKKSETDRYSYSCRNRNRKRNDIEVMMMRTTTMMMVVMITGWREEKCRLKRNKTNQKNKVTQSQKPMPKENRENKASSHQVRTLFI